MTILYGDSRAFLTAPHVKVTIIVEYPDGSNQIIDIPKASEMSWDVSYERPQTFPLGPQSEPNIESLRLELEPLRDDSGKYYTVTRTEGEN